MEEESRAPQRFPDLHLLISYHEALYYAQGRLAMFGQGEVKPFCAARGLPYTTIINLKNGKLKREEPRLLQRLLRHLAVPTELIRYPPASASDSFLLADAAALAALQARVAFFKSCNFRVD